jgi:hypothetical protein
VETPHPITLTAGAQLSDGSLVLLDESGHLLGSQDPRLGFTATTAGDPTYLTGLSELGDGQLVLSSARGLSLLSPATVKRSITREQ